MIAITIFEVEYDKNIYESNYSSFENVILDVKYSDSYVEAIIDINGDDFMKIDDFIMLARRWFWLIRRCSEFYLIDDN